MYKRLVYVAGLLLVMTGVVQSQTLTPLSKFAWKQNDQTLAVAQTLVYKYYLDGGATGVVLSGVVCAQTGTSIDCTAPVPAIPQGSHTLTVTATLAAFESAKSNVYSFSIVVLAAPSGLTAIP